MFMSKYGMEMFLSGMKSLPHAFIVATFLIFEEKNKWKIKYKRCLKLRVKQICTNVIIYAIYKVCYCDTLGDNYETFILKHTFLGVGQ